MQNYKAIIEYVGTNYSGFQIQPSRKTVAGEVERAIFELTKQVVSIIGSGRTDAGVHSKGQLINFSLKRRKNGEYFNILQIKEGLNSYLKNEEITVLKVNYAQEGFNARFHSYKRIYEYLILNRREFSPILKNRVWQVRKKIEVKKMQEDANLLLGEHNFTSFRNVDCQAKSPIKIIESIKILRKKDDLISIKIEAPSFLHNQVRIIVGTLVDLNAGKLEDIREVLLAKDRTKAGQTAPSCGLYFMKVYYREANEAN